MMDQQKNWLRNSFNSQFSGTFGRMYALQMDRSLKYEILFCIGLQSFS